MSYQSALEQISAQAVGYIDAKNAEIRALHSHIGALRAVIEDDAYAATFQTMGQYRGALRKMLLEARSRA